MWKDRRKLIKYLIKSQRSQARFKPHSKGCIKSAWKVALVCDFFFLLILKSKQYLLSHLRALLHLQGTFSPKAWWWPYALGITASVEAAQNKAGAHHFFIERHQITTIIQTSMWISSHSVLCNFFIFNTVSLSILLMCKYF